MGVRFRGVLVATAAAFALSAAGIAQTPAPPGSGTAGAANVPRTPDGKPDMSGVWQEMNYLRWQTLPKEDEQWLTPKELAFSRALTPATRGMTMAESREPRPYQPWAEKVYKYGQEPPGARFGRDRAELNKNCFPRDPKRIMDSNGRPSLEIKQSPNRLLILLEDDHWFRQVWINEEHPKNVEVTWMGHSVGKWDGDTLVIDTIAIDDRNSYGANMHSDAFHLVERLRRVSRNTIQGIVTVDDPKVYTRPWTDQTIIYKLSPPGAKLHPEVNCDFRFEKKLFGGGDI